MSQLKHVIVVGAGVGGLASAMRLLAVGARVTILEAAAAPGGKMRTVPSVAGPVDAGPTVLTMRWVFDDLFAQLGEAMDEHVTLSQAQVLARHFWSDGTLLDLCDDQAMCRANVSAAFGAKAAQQLDAFSIRAERLFTAFDTPMMRERKPSSTNLAVAVLKDPTLLAAMAPHKTLARLLQSSFTEPKLRQLFGRYATYVGGSPYRSPALLSLIWHAEKSGVWAVKGGMHQLAVAMATLIMERGARLEFNAPVISITSTTDGVTVSTKDKTHVADAVIFNGDPRALTHGLFGSDPSHAVPTTATDPRSLSANVMTFAAIPSGQSLSHHNVFFGDDPRAEFGPLSKGHDPTDPTLYICAQDRGGGQDPTGPERFEIIMNAPPCANDDIPNEQKARTCQTQILHRLAQMGLTFSPKPTPDDLTQPAAFHTLFPASLGALYGRSPHGLTAGLKRPTARTAVKGLYLAGGGAHPGAGVPMATLSAMHAVAAIREDLGLT